MSELSTSAFNDLTHILADLEMRKKLFMSDGALAKNFKLQKDGSVVLGRTKYDFINRLFGDRKELSVTDLCLRIIDEISGKGRTRNKDAFRALNLDFIEKALENKRFDTAISRLFLAYRIEFVGDFKEMEEYEDNHPDNRSGPTTIHHFQQSDVSGKEKYIAVCQDPTGSISLFSIKNPK